MSSSSRPMWTLGKKRSFSKVKLLSCRKPRPHWRHERSEYPQDMSMLSPVIDGERSACSFISTGHEFAQRVNQNEESHAKERSSGLS